jgi:hypothetical protein
MRYRDSDALWLPARAPEHAAPVRLLRRRGSPRQPGVTGRIRKLTRQALCFFVTAIAWTTGLGLVTGSIVLIATATAPGHGGPPPATSAPRQSEPDSVPRLDPRVAASAAGDYRVLATFSGHGDRTTADFSVKARLWQLRWTYRCTPEADAAQFTLLQADLGPGHPIVKTTTEDFTPSGRGSAWVHATGHQHYLKVISACSWHVKVMQAA